MSSTPTNPLAIDPTGNPRPAGTYERLEMVPPVDSATLGQLKTNGPAVLPKKTITLLVGDRAHRIPSNRPFGQAWVGPQTVLVAHHDTVLDILKPLGHATDGSYVMLKPGTNEVFGMKDEPYEAINDGDKLEVVPNRADHIGPFPDEVSKVHAETMAITTQPIPASKVAAVPAYPKVMTTETGPRTVSGPEEEEQAKAAGLVVDHAATAEANAEPPVK